MDPYELKREFGGRLVLHGAVDVQGWLQHASVPEIEQEVNRLMDEVGRGGGFILGPCHQLQPDTPTENVLAVYRTVAPPSRPGRCRDFRPQVEASPTGWNRSHHKKSRCRQLCIGSRVDCVWATGGRSHHIFQALERHDLDDVLGRLGLEDRLFFREGIDALAFRRGGLANHVDFHRPGMVNVPGPVSSEVGSRSAW